MSDYSEHLISMAGGDGDPVDRLAEIQKSNDMWMQSPHVDRNDRNTAFLLALVREQQARIDAVEAVAVDLAERGSGIEEKFDRNGNGSINSIRASGRGDGYREAARNIRAALTATHPETGS